MLNTVVKTVATFVTFAIVTFGAFAQSSTPTRNVTFGPFGLLVGAPNARLDLPIDEKWLIGPEYGYFGMDIGDFAIHASELRVSFGYYFDGHFADTFFAAPFLAYRKIDVSSDVDDVNANITLLGAIGGYHWFWEKFNIRLGAGIQTGLANAKVKIWNDSGVSETVNVVPSASIDVAFGFTF